jgi:putative Holliday junction resolvase
MDIKDKKILAIDFGEKVMGLASFYVNHDPFPMPFGRIVVKDQKSTLSELSKIINDESVDLIVVGVPRMTDGRETQMTKNALNFISLLRSSLSLSVFEQDETLSTFEAESRMKESPRYNFKIDPKQIDALAASIILEDFVKMNL